MLEQYQLLPAKLIEIAEFFNQLSLKEGVQPTVTRVSDTVQGESGVHPLHRAIDFRNEFFDGRVKRWTYPHETVEYFVETINTRYPRKDGKLVAIHHSFCNGPFHFHVQIAAYDLTKDEIARLYGSAKLGG